MNEHEATIASLKDQLLAAVNKWSDTRSHADEASVLKIAGALNFLINVSANVYQDGKTKTPLTLKP